MALALEASADLLQRATDDATDQEDGEHRASRVRAPRGEGADREAEAGQDDRVDDAVADDGGQGADLVAEGADDDPRRPARGPGTGSAPVAA